MQEKTFIPRTDSNPTFKDKVASGMRSLFPESPANLDLKDLYCKESQKLGDEIKGGAKSVRCFVGTAGEPWITSTNKDRLGLALSGGGIRSASFNLGLLQGLGQLGVLKHIDYLSTVSGGGYIGGFWTAWLKRRVQHAGQFHFPAGGDYRNSERPEIRHLREFSRFLLPRIKVLQTEFWGLVMTVLGGLLPSLLAATAVLILVWSAWLLLISSAVADYWSPASLVTMLSTYLIASELFWKQSKKSEYNWWETCGYCVGSALGVMLAWVGWANRSYLPMHEFNDGTLYGAFR